MNLLLTSKCTLKLHYYLQLVSIAVFSIFFLSSCGSFETEDPDRFIVSEHHGRLLIVDYSGVVKQTFDLTVRDASWSPDGKQIAFIDTQDNLGILETESGKVRPLASSSATSNTQYLRWSPVGRYLATISEPNRSSWTITVMALTGPPAITLSQSCDYKCLSPDWLPDGSGLIYAEYLGVEGEHSARVRKTIVETGAVSTLFNVDYPISSMRLSPYGTQLVLVAHGRGGAYFFE